MKRFLLVAGVLVVALMLAVVLWVDGESVAGPSTLSSGSEGWSAARRYLELSGTEVRLLDESLVTSLDEMAADAEPVPTAELAAGEEADHQEKMVRKVVRRVRGEEPSVLVLSFPRSTSLDYDDLLALERYVREGGILVAAYSGREADWEEYQLFSHFGIETDGVRRHAAPLSPTGWRHWSEAQWRLQPVDAATGPGLRPMALPVPMEAPIDPAAARVLMEARVESASGGGFLERGRWPAVFVTPQGRGQIVVLPSAAWGNGRLATGGAADLLETLRQAFDGPWYFDEYGHGLRNLETLEPPFPMASLRLFFVQILALYLLAVWTLSRHFGAPWREPELRIGSAASFLKGIATLHRRLGHHGDAARLLVERVGELEPTHPPPESLRRRSLVAEAEDLLPLAQAMARHRSRRPSFSRLRNSESDRPSPSSPRGS